MATATPKSNTAAAAIAEARGATSVEFEYEGAKYRALTSEEWPFEALERYEEGKVALFIGLILEPESLVTFRATKPKVGDLTAFVEAIQGALGIAGN